jgi:uncharacterized membrane protein YbhN (UPF0104 family)
MSKTPLVVGAKVAVTGLLLYFVLREVALTEVAARLAELSPWPLLAAAGMVGLQNVGVVTWRWERILGAIDQAVARWRLVGIVVISLFFNQVLPSTVGGDGMRMWLLHRRGSPLGAAVRSVIMDRLLGLLGLLLLTLAGALGLVWRHPESVPVWSALAAALGGIAVIAGAPLLLRLSGWLPFAAPRRHLETIAGEVETLWRDKPLLARLIGVSVLGHLFLCLAVWLTALAIGIASPLLGTLAVLPAVLLAASLPVSIAGWGVREGGMVVGLGLLGVAAGDAALVSVFFGLLYLAFGAAGGLAWLFQHRPRPAAGDALDVSNDMAAETDRK